MLVDDSTELEVPGDSLILGLIRSSVPKKVKPKKNGGSHVYKYKIIEDTSVTDTSVTDTSVTDTSVDGVEEKVKRPQGKKKWQSNYELSPHVAAVRYVRSERVMAGLSVGAKEELIKLILIFTSD